MRYRKIQGRTDFASFLREVREEMRPASVAEGIKGVRDGSTPAVIRPSPVAMVLAYPFAVVLRLFIGGIGTILVGAKQVKEVDGEADEPEIERMLRHRELRPNDLIFSQGSWVSLHEYPPFEDVCYQLRRGEAVYRVAGWAVASFAICGLLIGAAYVLMRIPEWILAAGR